MRLFESIDTDRSGTVSSKELFFACARAGLRVGLEDIKLVGIFPGFFATAIEWKYSMHVARFFSR